jgi:hypothetical protein
VLGPAARPGPPGPGWRRGGEAASSIFDCRCVEHGIVGEEGRSEWEERHVGHLVSSTGVEQRLIAAVGQVVGVLDTGHLRPGTGHEVLVQRHIAEPDGADEALVAKCLHGIELLGEGYVGLGMSPEIDDRDLIELQTGQVGLDPGAQLLGALGGQPLALLVPLRADLRDQDQRLGYGNSASWISSLATSGP